MGMATVGQGTVLDGGAARGDSAFYMGFRVRSVPEWVKDLRAEGTAIEEAARLGGGIKVQTITYWRRRLRMFSARSIFGDPERWALLRDLIEDATSPWEPTPFSAVLRALRENYGRIAEGNVRQALRYLVEDGVLTFTPPGSVGDIHGEDGFGGYTRPRRPIRQAPTDLTWDERDAVTEQDEARAARACR